jgi:hypothetical protein
MNTDYRIEFQPQLLEEAVLRAIIRHPDERAFWRERNRLYENKESDDQEKAFQNLHEKWFQRLGLAKPLRQVLALWPILTEATNCCLLINARSKKNLGVELYLAPEASGLNMRERRTIVVQLTPELLAQSEAFLEFLRHEFLHIVDMLDPHFGYEPDFPKTDAGPAYDHFLQGRYGVLWDMTIDGRLQRQGWLPPAAREKHFALFKRAFQGSEEKLSEVFSLFYDQNSHTHRELMEFAQHPEKWLGGETAMVSSKGRCAICQFPTFQLLDSNKLRADLVSKIQENFPTWNGTGSVCQQCVDLYEMRV